MNLNRAYRITLTKPNKRKRNKLVQYIEADCMDEAIRKALSSFEARNHGFISNGGSESQKACDKTVLSGKLTFGFLGGWLTEQVDGLTIFQALEKANANAFRRGEITEIHTAVSYWME